jgi:hypothetical protein
MEPRVAPAEVQPTEETALVVQVQLGKVLMVVERVTYQTPTEVRAAAAALAAKELLALATPEDPVDQPGPPR